MKRILLLSTLFVLANAFNAMSQQTVSGKITDSDGETLPGVNVVVKGTTTGTTTDLDGNYRISVEENGTLVISYVGFETQEISVGVRSVIDVTLGGVTELQEVVVTAIGLTREKKALGYAVQEVKNDELGYSQEGNVVQALSAKVAGVQVNQNSGVPGASTTIRIRGNTSISSSNEPLWVVDGVPIDNSISGGSGGGDGGTDGVTNSNRAIDLNPEDIESLTVLKGASATALYGVRAANGAIIVTTKRGSIGTAPTVSYSYSVTASEHNGMTPLQDTYSQGSGGVYGEPSTDFTPSALSWGDRIDNLVWVPSIENIWDKNGAVFTRSDAEEQGLEFIPMTPYDNLGDFYKTGITQNHFVSVRGGGAKTAYYTSFGYMDSEGIVPNSDFERFTAKINGDVQFTDQLKVSTGITYTNSGGTRIQQGSNISGVNLGLFRTPPSFDNSNGFGADAVDQPSSYLFPDGSQRTYRGGGGYNNPFFAANQAPHVDEVNRIISYIQINYAFSDWIDATYRVGNDFYNERKSQAFDINDRSFPSGQVWEREISNQDFNSDLILTFDKDFNQDFNAKLILGHNYYQTDNKSLFVQGDGLSIPGFFNLSNASTITTTDRPSTIKRTGAFFDVNFSYRDFLFLGITGRNDWSSVLPQNNNSFFYSSFNTSYIFTETFDIPGVSFGKLRGSYATVGNDGSLFASTDSYFQSAAADGTRNAIADGWTNGLGFPYSGTPGFTQQTTQGNANLGPEKTKSWEVGLEMRFLNSRLGFDATYFDVKAEDLIINTDISAATGYRSVIDNAAEITNNGFELMVDFNVLDKGELGWNLNLNYTNMENTVEELAPSVENILLSGFTGTSSRAVAGQPYGVIYGGTWERDDNGSIVIGADGYPVSSGISEVIGDPNPDWTMGIRNTFNYKAFTFTFLFDIREGGDMWNGTKGALTFFGTSELTENRGDVVVFDGVTSDGQPNTKQVVLDESWYSGNGGGFGSVAEHFVEETSWVRLRDVSISYSFPEKIIGPFKGVDFTLAGRNLLLFTPFDGVDPETSLTGSAGNATAQNGFGLEYFNFPNTKSISGTLRLRL